MSKVAIAFIATGLVVVPAVELANADSDIQYCKIIQRRIPIKR
ncbi:MAG TPA: hypothetical protein VFK40_14620 [Nitrososphaeraceae archaeon]|nr:hypothetical protein [Nitrososphaeraceae archaeon]